MPSRLRDTPSSIHTVEAPAFTDSMDKLASEIAAACCNPESELDDKVPLGDKIDAFKALMPYYAFKMKNKGKEPSELDGLPTFDNFARNIHGTETDDGSDEPRVSGRSRRNGSGNA